MALVNEHLLKLPDDYFSPVMERKINLFKAVHPKADLICLEKEDVCLPVPESVAGAMVRVVKELADTSSFRGYGPKQGYDFLIESIVKHEFQERGVALEKSEIFITEGTQSNIGNIGNLLRHDNSIGIASLAYPVYAAASIMCGRAGEFQDDGRWNNVIYISCPQDKGFVPQVPETRIDIVYLSHPHVPTGSTLNRTELKKWVNYAIRNDALIMFDATYEAYIQHPDIPHSIYEIKGAKKVAIEYRTFSRTAGFSGVRCGYVVIPQELTATTLAGNRISLNHLWRQHQHIKYNGTSYIAQRGAEASLSPEGKKEIKAHVQYYMENARLLREGLSAAGLQVTGGVNAPFVWIRVPDGMDDWQFFHRLLYEAQVVVEPGSRFGPEGKSFARICSFNERERCREAVRRIQQCV